MFFLFQTGVIPPDRDCALECGPEKTCFTDTCCATKDSSTKIEMDMGDVPQLENGTATRLNSRNDNEMQHRHNAVSL